MRAFVMKVLPGTAAAFTALPWEELPGRQGFRSKQLTLADGTVLEQRQNYCPDCQALDPDFFVVQDTLWREHGNGSGLLCVLCFEKRLGRRLTVDDLKPRARLNSLALHIAGHDVPMSCTN